MRLDETVFSVGDRAYDWSDIVLAATLWGDWAAFVREVRLGLACAKEADDLEEDADPDDVESAANEFRYERDLLTAEETEAWFARWGLAADDWTEYIRRSVLRRQWMADASASPDQEVEDEEAEDEEPEDEEEAADVGDEDDDRRDLLAEYPVTDDEVEEVLWAEGILSGRFARYAFELAARAAVYERARDEGQAEFDARIGTEAQGVLGREAPDLTPPGVLGLSDPACRAKLEGLARLEAAFRRVTTQVVTPHAIEGQLDAHRLDWMRFDVGRLSFHDEQAAKEAALSVREDGLTLAEVAGEAKAEVQEARLYLDQLDPAVRDQMVGARRGDLVGPLNEGGAFALLWVRDKVLPSEADPETRRRAEQALWEGVVEREVARRVRWHRRL